MNAKTDILCIGGLSWGPTPNPRWAGGWAWAQMFDPRPTVGWALGPVFGPKVGLCGRLGDLSPIDGPKDHYKKETRITLSK
jgi:hypothetical protein